MTYVLLALRFLIELCLFAAWGVIGYSAVDNRPLGIVLAIVLAVATAAIWGVFLSPRRPTDLSLAARVAIELVLFAAAGVLLALLGYPLWAALLVVAELVILGGLALAGFRPGQEPAALRP